MEPTPPYDLVTLRLVAEGFLQGTQTQMALGDAMHEASRAGYPPEAREAACEAALDRVIAAMRATLPPQT